MTIGTALCALALWNLCCAQTSHLRDTCGGLVLAPITVVEDDCTGRIPVFACVGMCYSDAEPLAYSSR